MAWSNSLAAFAQQWADSLARSGKFVHRSESGHGENLFEIRGGKAVPSQVVGSWVDEKKDHQPSTHTCKSGAECRHYTQVVWKASLRLEGLFICRHMSAALELEILHGKFGSVTTIHRVTGSGTAFLAVRASSEHVRGTQSIVGSSRIKASGLPSRQAFRSSSG
jgi:hypothetical protein